MTIDLSPEEKARYIGSSEQLYEILKRILLWEDEIGQEREHLWAVGFQQLNYIKFIELVSLGTLTETLAVPREVYRMAVAQGCNRLVVAHNHPSGLLRPSPNDKELTQRLWDAGELLGVKLLDHLIISKEGYLSLFYLKGKGPFSPDPE